jgi:hypothetical protein
MAASYAQTTVTLSAGQAAGTAPLIAANRDRRALQLGAAVDFKVALSASATDGMRVYASARDGFEGALCPAGELYLVAGSGLSTGNAVVVWEA